MPNGNENIQFSLKYNSAAAKRIDALSDQELFERYFMPTNNPNWKITDDSMNALRLKDEKTDRYRFEKSRSIMGSPFDYFVTALYLRIVTYIPQGYKLNMANIVYDFETILAENSEQARTIAKTKEVTDFLYDLTRNFTDLANRGLDYALGQNVEL